MEDTSATHRRSTAVAVALALVLALLAPLVRSAPAGAVTGIEEMIGLTRTNALVRLSVADPGTILSTTPVTGLQAGEDLLGTDFRPATGQLLALGSTSRLYSIAVATGAATAVGAGPFAPVLSGGFFGFDVNPTVDRVRVVSDTGQNLSINPNTGVATAQAALNPGAPKVTAAAYTNNVSGATSTTLYVIDSTTDRLMIQNPPASGTLSDVGALGVDTGDEASLEIAGNGGVAYAAITPTGGTSTQLRTVNLTSGATTSIGTVGGGQALRGISIFTGPAKVLTAVDTANNLIQFSADLPGDLLRTTPITGLQGGETILGIDYRPATGQLFALGSTSRLYTIAPATAAATALGAGPFTPALSGTSFGFDFNPTADRIRVVSDTEQSLRLNPGTGAVAAVDANLTPAGDVVAAAYDRSAPATPTATTLFAIDSGTDSLVRIGGPDGTPSPNGGMVTAVGALGVDTAADADFDIAAAGAAYAALNVGGAKLYTVALASGAATLVGAIGAGASLRGLASVPTGGVALSAAAVTTNEKAGTVAITVNRTAGSAGPARVDVTTSNGTATAPGDYTATAVTVVFGDGETSRTVAIPIIDDTVSDPDETFGVALSNPVGAVVLSPGTATVTISGEPDQGYFLVASDGGVFAFGDAAFKGSTGAIRLNSPVVGMATTPSGDGYFLVAADGGVFAFGDAVFRGSMGATRLAKPIVGMATTPSGNGYFLVAADGGIFAFGDAVFRGSMGATRLTKPIVGMARTLSGAGYFLVAADGGVFAFGDAVFRGSMGATRLAKPIVGMAATPSGAGYFLVASDGGVFAFGDATFRGSTGASRLNQPVVGMAATASGAGYWLVASDGGIFAFGDAVFQGSTGASRLNRPVVGMAATP